MRTDSNDPRKMNILLPWKHTQPFLKETPPLEKVISGAALFSSPKIDRSAKHKKEHCMAKKEVERLLIAGGKDKSLKLRYNTIASKEDFVAAAKEDGYDFTIEELDQVLKENGDDFTRNGNPPQRSIWWA